MFDYAKACTLGLTVHCTAPTAQPVTVSGQYRCTAGHRHSVRWSHGEVVMSHHGYDPAFLAALDAAEDAAIAIAAPETPAYQATYNALMRERGFGAVLLSA